MYHYTECGLQNVWLENGYEIEKTPYGKAVAIQDVAGLHRLIGREIARRPRLTGAELRFLRKELDLSQRGLAGLLGTSEQNVSLWERRGKVPRGSARLLKILYLERLEGNVKVREIIDNFVEQDEHTPADTLRLKVRRGIEWKAAA
ncbi:MAG TPA: transcriptional regulator [Casimicrobiaceae bacterium]|nr:transcriptional regulator [Casimicrobiaceae bacterium]